MQIRVLVLATNASGDPEFKPYITNIDDHDYSDGLHYEWAKDEAREDGFEPPMIAFDEHDEAARQMGEQFYTVFNED